MWASLSRYKKETFKSYTREQVAKKKKSNMEEGICKAHKEEKERNWALPRKLFFSVMFAFTIVFFC